ncbi:Dolichyl-phosphate beta-glucosyltransferase [Gryllus bimaculatus]|nr:Dolichyl-phosphate beta-glucosyltransferase [Gryllus bimaculatus]
MVCIVVIITTAPYPIIHRAKEEKCFINPVSGEKHNFPTLSDPHSVHLSVVVPAYNEEVRLPPMLDECLEYLQSRPTKFKYEVIVVSDGSTDKTAQVAREYTKKYGTDIVRVLELITNRGKGGAVRLGIQNSRGAAILFADADGATKFSDLSKLEASLNLLTGADYASNPEDVSGKAAIVCGSRAHLEQEAIASRSYFRTILMYGFHFLVWFFAVRSLRDTQCGFKLLTRKAAKVCFANMHVERWAFDVELLYIAERLKIPISEIAVNWTEIEGSKVVPVWSWLQMGRDLFLIWLRYRIGAWKLADKSE